MPQMKPILWLYLFFMFSLTIFCYKILNYYIFLYKFNTTINNKTSIFFLNWKW